jgi:hypothetical protein
VSVGTEDNDKMGELADTINVKVTLDMELWDENKNPLIRKIKIDMSKAIEENQCKS